MPSLRNSKLASSPPEPLNRSLFPAKLLAAAMQATGRNQASTGRTSPMLRRWRNGAGSRPLLQIAICIAAIFFASSMAAQPSAGARPALRTRFACPPAARPFAIFVTEAAQRFRIPESWIRAVMRVESFGDARAISQKGAIGLMQVMPKTYAELRVRHRLGADPCDPHNNILAGPRISARCSIAMARPDFSPPTMPVRRVTTNISSKAGRCQARPRTTSRSSRR
jgi:soluble lytic murein transglycosylase-like protein